MTEQKIVLLMDKQQTLKVIASRISMEVMVKKRKMGYKLKGNSQNQEKANGVAE